MYENPQKNYISNKKENVADELYVGKEKIAFIYELKYRNFISVISRIWDFKVWRN